MEVIRRAEHEDFDAVWDFYTDVCEQMSHDRYAPGWTLGLYPSEEDVRDATEAGTLWLCIRYSKVVASMVLNPVDDQLYESVPWPSGASGEEASCIHLLAVHPSARGTDASDSILIKAIDLSRSWGKRAIHLDVRPQNLVARRLYERVGFSFVGEQVIVYEDLGAVTVEVFEYAL